jgi:hypothetical protein
MHPTMPSQNNSTTSQRLSNLESSPPALPQLASIRHKTMLPRANSWRVGNRQQRAERRTNPKPVTFPILRSACLHKFRIHQESESTQVRKRSISKAGNTSTPPPPLKSFLDDIGFPSSPPDQKKRASLESRLTRLRSGSVHFAKFSATTSQFTTLQNAAM